MLTRARGALYNLLWKLPPPVRDRVLARQLARDPDYSFTADYISGAMEHWEELLSDQKDRPGLRALEIGSYEGRSAVWFLQNVVTHPSAELTCVDPWFWREDELRFDHNLGIAGHADRVKKLKGTSEEVLPQLPPATFDLIYVDGSHQAAAVLFDAVLSWRLLKPGGVLMFDDYAWKPEKPPHERPEMAVDLFLELYEGRYELLLKGYQVAVRRLADS